MKKKFYFLYKTTNLKNGKFYIGVHSTTNLNDGYMGSGKRFKNSLYYHGRENFKREILEFFDTKEEMFKREIEIINEEFLKNPKVLNLKLGGSGGFTNKQHQSKCCKAASLFWKSDIGRETRRKSSLQLHQRDGYYEKISKALKGRIPGFQGKFHSIETKHKISETKKGTYSGKSNSQYGTCWITNGNENKKIYKGDNIPKGWSLGRKMINNNK